MQGPERVASEIDPFADRARRIRELLRAELPEAFAEGQFDPAVLRVALGEPTEDRPERYLFTWAGKREAINLLRLPTRATLVPIPDESVNFDTTQNLFIEGDNLEVLKLLYRAYSGRVKMIYIDPPYNTGNDFIYPDNFADPLARYLQLTGQQDAEGNLLTSNPERAGRYHSTWLSMMYPRLFLARQLLRDDGVIFISIDDHEVHNLRVLMNEVFGEENFIALIVVQTNPRGRTLDRYIAKTHEYVMVFARNADSGALGQLPKDSKALAEYDKRDDTGQYRELELRNRNPVFNRENRPNLFFSIFVDPVSGQVALSRSDRFSVEVLPLNSRGEEGCWTWGPKKVKESINLLVSRQVGTGAWRVFRKDYLPPDEGQVPTTKAKSLWLENSMNHENGKEEVGRLFGYSPFDFPKSVELVKKCIQLGTTSDREVVLDFFAGSSTTAQAVLDLNREDGGNRQFVMIQLPQPMEQEGFSTIADISKERIRRVSARLTEEAEGKLDLRGQGNAADLGFRVFKLAGSHLRAWRGLTAPTAQEYAAQLALFNKQLSDDVEVANIIWEAALREGFPLTSQIAPVVEVTTNSVQQVFAPGENRSFFICLDARLDDATLDALPLTKTDLFVCRDSALTDTLAANLAQQCELRTL